MGDATISSRINWILATEPTINFGWFSMAGSK